MISLVHRFVRPFFLYASVVLLAGLVIVQGCTTSTVAPFVGTPPVFTQLERLAVPALNELFMDFNDHDASNRSTPTADQARQTGFIRSFITAIGRPSGIADAVVAVAIPDVIEADLSQPTGTYFGVELAGLGVIPANFGGRRPTDDPIDVTLSVVFGDAVTGITDGQIPGLLTDNVGPNAIGVLTTFPYLGNPI